MPFEIGESVGPYRILEQLGQGGMATVYKAYHANLDRYVAIKILHPSLKGEDAFLNRFQREAQIVAKLQHPHIVPVFDFSTDGKEPYIVMKFIEGYTLKHLLKRKHLSLEETLTILPAVAAALTYAHNRGILHRDVKPSNIMLEGDGTPYLADFGLARIASAGESTMSQDVLIGTPNYISPEQARGDKDLGAATDIYSLGIILYEIVVGRVPFSADTPYAVVHDHIYKALPIPSQVNPTVPAPVEAVLLKTLSKDPADRYPSAVAMLEAFQEAISTAEMTELSAASVRLERFEDTTNTLHISSPTAAPGTPTPTPDLNLLVRAAVNEVLATQQAQADSAVPPVVAPYMMGKRGSSIARRRRNQRQFWIIIGVAALIFTCIASLGITINALQNPIIQSNPALANAPEEVIPPEPRPFIITQEDIARPMAEAQQYQAENPTDPLANLLLSFKYLQNGDLEQAQKYLVQAVNSPGATGEMFAEAASTTASEGFSDSAVLLWFIAHELAPDNPRIRNDAGTYIYQQLGLSMIPPENIPNVLQIRQEKTTSGFISVMVAQALLTYPDESMTDERRLIRSKAFLDAALEKGDVDAEANLVYGNYYALAGEMEKAIEAWEYARSFVDTPQWVEAEASAKIRAAEEIP